MSEALKFVPHEDATLPKWPPARVGEPGSRGDVDTTRLMDVLGDIDGLKHEIQERMKRIEAVKQAKSILMEDALRTEALNQKLGEIGRAMSAARSGSPPAMVEDEDVEAIAQQMRDSFPEADSRRSPVRTLNESAAIAWPKPEDAILSPLESEEELGTEDLVPGPGDTSPDPVADSVVVNESHQVAEATNAALERLEQAEQAWKAALLRAEMATAEAKGLFEESTSQLNQAVGREEQAAAEFRSARESFAAAFQGVTERIEEAEGRWSQTDQVAVEARRLLEDSASRLSLVESREEQATAECRSARESFAAAFKDVTERIEEAEGRWSQTEKVAVEARRLLEDSASRLSLAESKEISAAADLQAAQKALTSGYQSATERLEEAERFWRNSDQAGTETKQMLELSTTQMNQARASEEAAAFELVSARQELTTAYQFAAVAAQRRLDSAVFFRKAVRWAIVATTFSWIATVWTGWLALRTIIPIWEPCVASVVFFVIAVASRKAGARAIGSS